jgi:hypothetical protein
MEAVLKYLENESNRRRYPDGAILGVYRNRKKDNAPVITIIPFPSEQEANDYLATVVPDALRAGSVVIPINNKYALML